jgi:hypothetical protein
MYRKEYRYEWKCHFNTEDFSSATCQHSPSNVPRLWQSVVKNGITGESAGNCQIMDEESTGGMVIPLGITSSGMKNPP